MIHASETGAIIDSTFLAPVSAVVLVYSNLGLDSSGTRCRHRFEHCSVPSQKVACTWLKWSFVIYFFSTDFPLAAVSGIIIATTSANSSSTSLSATFIFGARNFHSRRIRRSVGYRQPGRTAILLPQKVVTREMPNVPLSPLFFAVTTPFCRCYVNCTAPPDCRWTPPPPSLCYWDESRRQKMESINRAGFWSMCHGYNGGRWRIDASSMRRLTVHARR